MLHLGSRLLQGLNIDTWLPKTLIQPAVHLPSAGCCPHATYAPLTCTTIQVMPDAVMSYLGSGIQRNMPRQLLPTFHHYEADLQVYKPLNSHAGNNATIQRCPVVLPMLKL